MMESSSARRRRGPAFVTLNACTECRKKRTKCDGKNPCSRCNSQGDNECVYEVPTRQSKEEMRKEISQLRAHQRHTDQLLAGLTTSQHPEEVLDKLRNEGLLQNGTSRHRSLSMSSSSPTNNIRYPQFSDSEAVNHASEPMEGVEEVSPTVQPVEETFEVPSQGQQRDPPEQGSVRRNSAHRQPGSTNWTTNSTTPIHAAFRHTADKVWRGQVRHPVFDSVSQSARHRGQDLILGHATESESPSEHHDSHQSYELWTAVTRDRELVEHLLALYFCWEYPIFASLSKQHFLEDFRHRTPRYCSHMLVNALLALACRWSDRPSTRADPEDSATAGNHFFSEALRLYRAEKNHRNLTTIQALGIMSIREASCGRASRSIFFSGQSISLAIEMGLHHNAEESNDDRVADAEDAVRAATFWGAFSLDEAWSLCNGKVPHLSISTNLTVKPAIITEVECQPWVPYTDDGAPLAVDCTQASNIRVVYKTFCELSEIIHRTLYIIYTPGSHILSGVLLDAYHQYILWYDTIPDALRLGQNFTPAVLFTHLHYHFAILMLFRPFAKLRIIESDVSPQNICTQAANTISKIIRSYSNLYTLRRTPSFVPYIVLSSSIFHLAMVHSDATSAYNKMELAQNVSDLMEMSSCHIIAARALDILQFLAQLWEVDGIFDKTHEGLNLQSHSHPSFILMGELSPLTGSVSMMHNIVPWPSAAENPLHAPFPIQSRPSVALGSKLKEDGFALVDEEE